MSDTGLARSEHRSTSALRPQTVVRSAVERNRLLRALPPESFAKLEEDLEPVQLAAKQVLWEPTAQIHSIYFPLTSVASLIVTSPQDAPVEAATVGCEGFVGVPVLLGADSTTTRAIIQIGGNALRLPARVFRDAVEPDPRMLNVFLRYAQALQEQTAHSVACNVRHSVEQRCARWLLLTHDRVDGPEFYLTQEFLATMLGVRRATITVAAGSLQQAGLIRYARGHVTILDREGLEALSCDCYRVVRDVYSRLLG